VNEEELRAATIGEPRRLDGPVALVAWDPAWPSLFEREAERIRAILGPGLLLLEHVGSTAVPGLAAKPVIDMVMAVPDSANEAAYVPSLERRGYVLRIREPDWFEHRLLEPPDLRAHLHVFSAGCEEIGRMLAFRDRLRADAGDRLRYEETKRRLASRYWKYAQEYADAKSDVVREILGRGADVG
jgi:GrpB-like predicted nucleotidyltransferase (UPF0157 family)